VVLVGAMFWPSHLRTLREFLTNDYVQRVLGQPLFQLGSFNVTPAFLILTVVYIIVLGVVTGATRRLLHKRLLSRTALDLGQRDAYARIAGYVLFMLGIVIGLQSSGVNLNSLLVLGGAVGIGVGFGLQPLVGNFVAGFILLFERPVKLGDRVEVGGVVVDVLRMAARSTWVRTNENVVIIVPNLEFISNRVTNWTANDRRVRFSIPIGVSYGCDPGSVRDLLLDTARHHSDVLNDPPPDVLFLGFGDSALNFELRVWTLTKIQTPQMLASDLYFAVFAQFKEHGIEIPFPQRDLHLKSVSAPISITSH